MFTEKDGFAWEGMLSRYDQVLQLVSDGKKKKAPKTLVQLDGWFQKELPQLISGRKRPFINREELVKLVEWKLMRGKFRPRLVALAGSNEDNVVKTTSQEAFSLLPDVKAAMNKLCELKGIGPATASAVLCAASMGDVPFMADESMEAVPNMGAIAYTETYFAKYIEKLKAKSQELNAAETGTRWNPHLVELALWTSVMAKRFGVDTIPKESTLKRSSNSDPDQSANKKRRKQS